MIIKTNDNQDNKNNKYKKLSSVVPVVVKRTRYDLRGIRDIDKK